MSSAKRSRNDGALAAGDSNASKKPKVNGSITSFFGAPKPAAAAASAAPVAGNPPASAPALKFNKEKWVAGLTPEQRQFLNLEIETMDPSWLAVLKDEIVTPQFIELKKFLDREAGSGKKIFPPREDIYSWTRHTPFHTVKCVIVGQDPYHNVNQAHGLAFSVRPPTPAPPSLRNMYKALQRDYPDPAQFSPPPKNGGLLTPWADRGVLMLNTCLTVRAHEANSHANRGWERFTQRAIDLVAQRRAGRGVVFLAWGTPAGKRVQKVDRTRHLVLQAVHPSPLSAVRGGFFDCGHFRKTNDWLVARYGPGSEIDWNLNKWANAKPAAAADGDAKKTASDATNRLASPVKTTKKQEPVAKEEENYDDDDDDADALAAAVDAATAEAKAKAEAEAKKAEAEAEAEAETAKKPADDKAEVEAEAAAIPLPIVVVGQVKDDESSKEKKKEETSKVLDKEGENTTAVAAVEAEAETEPEPEPEAKAKAEVEPEAEVEAEAEAEVEPEAEAEADSKATDDDDAKDDTKAEATAEEAEETKEEAEESK